MTQLSVPAQKQLQRQVYYDLKLKFLQEFLMMKDGSYLLKMVN